MPPSFGKVKGRSDPQLVAAQARLREAVAATPASRTLGQQQHQELALHLSEDGDLLDAVNEKLARLRLPKITKQDFEVMFHHIPTVEFLSSIFKDSDSADIERALRDGVIRRCTADEEAMAQEEAEEETQQTATPQTTPATYRVRYYFRLRRSETTAEAQDLHLRYAEAFPQDERSSFFVSATEAGAQHARSDWYFGTTLASTPAERLASDLAKSSEDDSASRHSTSSLLNLQTLCSGFEAYELVHLAHDIPATGAAPPTIQLPPSGFQVDEMVAERIRQAWLDAEIDSRLAPVHLSPSGFPQAIRHAPLTESLSPAQAFAVSNSTISKIERFLIAIPPVAGSWNSAVQGGIETAQWVPDEDLLLLKQDVDAFITQLNIDSQVKMEPSVKKQTQSRVLSVFLTALDTLGRRVSASRLITPEASVAAAKAACASIDQSVPVIVIGKDVPLTDAKGLTTFWNPQGAMGSAAHVFASVAELSGLEMPVGFVNLFAVCTLHWVLLEICILILRMLLAILIAVAHSHGGQPILVCMSAPVCHAFDADWMSHDVKKMEKGSDEKNFIERVGTLRSVNINGVSVPAMTYLHPGSLKYRNLPRLAHLRVSFLLDIKIRLLVAVVSMQRHLGADAQYKMANRLRIMERTDQLLQSTVRELQGLNSQMSVANIAARLRREAKDPSAEAARRDKASSAMKEAAPRRNWRYAEGQAGSDARKRQMASLEREHQETKFGKSTVPFPRMWPVGTPAWKRWFLSLDYKQNLQQTANATSRISN